MGADHGDAHLTDNGCGVVQESNMPIIPDPYSGLASNIPANPCASYPQEPSHHGDPALPSSNQWSSAQTLSGNKIVCGDLQLTSDVTINAPAGATLVIENGQLDTNGYTLSTASGLQGSGVSETLTGTNFGGTVNVSGSGVTVTSVNVVSSTSLTANFFVSPTATTRRRPSRG